MDLTEEEAEFEQKEAFIGAELVHETHRLALINAMLHDIEGKIYLCDTLSNQGLFGICLKPLLPEGLEELEEFFAICDFKCKISLSFSSIVSSRGATALATASSTALFMRSSIVASIENSILQIKKFKLTTFPAGQ